MPSLLDPIMLQNNLTKTEKRNSYCAMKKNIDEQIYKEKSLTYMVFFPHL